MTRPGKELHQGCRRRWKCHGVDGTAAGPSTPSILTAIAKASLSADAVIVPTCVATAFKMTAAGKINLTVATGPLTAGVIEV